MLDQILTLSTMSHLSALLLSLAILLPLVGLVYGSARGLPLAQLSGVMIAYWALALLSLVAAAIAFSTGEAKGGVLLPVTAASIVVPLAIKSASKLMVEKVHKLSESTPSAQTKQLPTKCRPQLASADVRQIEDSKTGHDGKLRWHLWMGNYYEWRLEYRIEADDTGASGTASATGEVSTWYSLKVRQRRAVASAKGSIDCEHSEGKCLSVAEPDSQSNRDIDFQASVEARTSESGGRSVVEVVCFAEVAGTPGLSGVSVGTGIAVNLQAPNTARDDIRKSRSYSYRCLQVEA